MVSNMPNIQGSTSRTSRASVPAPKSLEPEMSLRRGAALLNQINDVGLVEMLLQQGIDIDIDQHSMSKSSVGPHGAEPVEHARLAKEALGMSGSASKTLTLTPGLKAEVISNLMSVVADVTIFDPVGSFVIPFHQLLITKHTSLSTLITSIQAIIDGMLKSQKGLKGPLLASAVQIKIFNGGQFSYLPKIKGILKGSNTIEPPSGPIGSSVAIARQLAYQRGELDEKEIPRAEMVKWLVGPGSDEEAFWEQYRIAMQIDKVKQEYRFTSSFPHTAEKPPMIKVMTVRKYGLLSLLIGDHNFQICERISTQLKETRMEDNTNNKGKGRAGPNDGMIENARDAFQTRYAALGINIHNSEIDFALDFARALNNNEQQSPNTTTRQVLSHMQENGREPLPEVTIKSASEKMKEPRWILNWGTYQKMGGDPRMHELFPLEHVPFKPQEYYMHKGKHEQGPQPDANTDAHDPTAPVETLANYCALDPSLIEMLMEDKNTREQIMQRDMNEMAVGFDELDDEKFLSGILSPTKPVDTANPPVPLRFMEPFPDFHTQRQEQRQDSPLQHYGSHVDHADREESPVRDPMKNDLGDILSRLTALSATADTYEGPSYTFGGMPLSNAPNSYRPSSPHVTNSNVPRGSRWFPSSTTQTRSPSPSKTNLVPANTMEQPVQNVNRFQSFSAFNAASAEMHAQAQTQQVQGFFQTSPVRTQDANAIWYNTSPTRAPVAQASGYYSISPTKTHAQMSRAFNAPTSNTFTAPQPVPVATPAAFDFRSQAQGASNVQNRSQLQGHNQGQRNMQFQGQTHAKRQGPNNMYVQGQTQGQRQMQNQSISANNQGSSSTTPSNAPSQLTGATAFYAGITSTGTQNTFNIGAGTSRAWSAAGNTTSRNARGNLSSARRPAQSQLRADSPSFQSGLARGGNRNRAISSYMRGVYAQGPGGNFQQMGTGSTSTQQSLGTQTQQDTVAPEPQLGDTSTKASEEPEHYMGVD